MSALFAGLPPWADWMILACLLGAGEIILPGVFLIWIAIAAALTGAAVLVFPAMPIEGAVLLFALLSLAAGYGGKRWYDRTNVPSADPLLNDRAARMVGRTVTVCDAIEGGEGRVKLDDGTWTATGPDAPVGARMTVVAANGPVLTVALPSA